MKDIKTRICNTCKRDLPIAEFNLNRGMNGGWQPYCKLCSGMKVKDWQNDKRKQKELDLRAERRQLTLFEVK